MKNTCSKYSCREGLCTNLCKFFFNQGRKMKSIITVVASSMFAVTAFAQTPTAPAKKEEAKPAVTKPAATKPAPPVIPPAPAKKDEKKAEPAKK
jgi:hypothetical protein